MKITKRNKSRENTNLPVVHTPVNNVFALMDRLLNENFWSPLELLETELVPRVDISETDAEVKIRADVPGIDPEKINIEVTEDSLSLSGSIEKSEEEEGENYYRLERQTGQFSREFILPSKIDPNSVEAKAKNGTITITLKKQPSEQKRKVQIIK